MLSEVLLLLAAALLVVACGAFVAAEFSFLTVDRAAVERAAAGGDHRAAGTARALRSLSTQLSGAQLGITVTNLAIGYLAEPAIGSLLDGPLESVGLSAGGARATSVALALLLSTLLTMIFGELVPKNLAIARPLATAGAVQGFSRGASRLAAWPIRGLNAAANTVLRRVFHVEPAEELASARSADELLSLVRRSADQGTLELETATLVRRSLAFADRRAADVMTPRVRVHTLHADADLLALVDAVHATGRSRFPITGDALDDVVGVVHARQVLAHPPERAGGVLLSEVAEPALLVPETLELDELLDRLKDSPLQLAVVIDEYGGFAGVVTFEDLVEEIVGEVVDEHDARTSSVRRLGPETWLLSGLLRPDEVGEQLGVALTSSRKYETVAGLVVHQLDRVPTTGDTADVPLVVPVPAGADDPTGARGAGQGAGPVVAVRLRVEAVDGLRVATLRATLLRGVSSGG